MIEDIQVMGQVINFSTVRLSNMQTIFVVSHMVGYGVSFFRL